MSLLSDNEVLSEIEGSTNNSTGGIRQPRAPDPEPNKGESRCTKVNRQQRLHKPDSDESSQIVDRIRRRLEDYMGITMMKVILVLDGFLKP